VELQGSLLVPLQRDPLHHVLIATYDLVTGVAGVGIGVRAPDALDAVARQSTLVELALDEEPTRFLVHGGLPVIQREHKCQIHRSLDARRRQPEKAKVQAGLGYTRYVLADRQSSSHMLKQRTWK
jgi:hypothetical protein